IRRPLAGLAAAAQRMGAGDLATRAPQPYSRDELGVVARSFDGMAGALQARMAELRDSEHRLRENLERIEAAGGRVRQQLEHMNLLDQITRSIGERLDLNSIFQVVAGTLEQSLPVDFCCVALREGAEETLRVERVGIKSYPLARGMQLEEGEGID